MSTLDEPALLTEIFESKCLLPFLEMRRMAYRTGFRFFAHGGAVYRFANDHQEETTEAIGDLAEWYAKLVPEKPMEDRSSSEPRPALPPVTELLAKFEGEIVVAEAFYADPRAVRELALSKEFSGDDTRYQGKRTADFPIGGAARAAFEKVTGPVGRGHSCFQLNFGGDARVYHSDTQRWAAAVYLTENPPPAGGTSFYRSRAAKAVRSSAHLSELALETGITTGEAERLIYANNLLDRTKWQEVDRVGNVFNRLVIWDARLVHAVTEYFGSGVETGRLVQLFFWDPA